jgi:hypothetical protein
MGKRRCAVHAAKSSPKHWTAVGSSRAYCATKSSRNAAAISDDGASLRGFGAGPYLGDKPREATIEVRTREGELLKSVALLDPDTEEVATVAASELPRY